jgi:predicted transposase YbfD/YdcC
MVPQAQNDDGPFSASFPEEGDEIDQSVFIVHEDAVNWEVIEITRGSTAHKIKVAKKLALLLNRIGARLCSD